MLPFLRQQQPAQRSPRQERDDFDNFFSQVDQLVNTDNPFVCPVSNTWKDIQLNGLRNSALLISTSLIEGAKRMNQLPSNLDLSRMIPQFLTIEVDQKLQHFILLLGSQVIVKIRRFIYHGV